MSPRLKNQYGNPLERQTKNRLGTKGIVEVFVEAIVEAIAIVVHVLMVVIGEARLVEAQGGAIDPMEEGEMVLAEMEGEAEEVVPAMETVTETEEGTVGRELRLRFQHQHQFQPLHPNQRKSQASLPLLPIFQVQRVHGEDSHLQQLQLLQRLSHLQLLQLPLHQLLLHKLQLLNKRNQKRPLPMSQKKVPWILVDLQ